MYVFSDHDGIDIELLGDSASSAGASKNIARSNRKWTQTRNLFNSNSSNCASVSASRLCAIIVSAIPFISFLLIYGANCSLLVLPTSECGGSGACHRQPRPGDLSDSKPLETACSGQSSLFNIEAFEVSLVRFSFNRVVASLQSPALDLLSTVPYLLHYVLPIVYPFCLVILGRDESAREFYQRVGWSMWTLYALWYLLPTGPPWYYDGKKTATVDALAAFNSTINASARGPNDVIVTRRLKEGPAFARVDLMTGGHFFRTMFAANPVPYAAFPSGHIVWPMCVYLTQPWSNKWPFVAYVTLVAWATMYSGHHYLSDVIGAVVVSVLVNRVLSMKPIVKCSPEERTKLTGFRVRLRSVLCLPLSFCPILRGSTDRQPLPSNRNKGLSTA